MFDLDQQTAADVEFMFNSAVNHMLRCLGHEMDDIAECVEEFAAKYVYHLEAIRKRRNPDILTAELEHLKGAILLQS